jgi:hypothetical protein
MTALGHGGGRGLAGVLESWCVGGGSLVGASESRRAWCRGCRRMGERWPKRRPEDWRRSGRQSPGHAARAEAGTRRLGWQRLGHNSQGGGRGAAGGWAGGG